MNQTTKKRGNTYSAAKPYTARKNGGDGTARSKSPRKKNGGSIPAAAVFVVVLVAGIAIAGAALWARGFYGETIIEGVSVNGRDVGGLTREEARALIEAELRPIYEKASVRLTYEDREWTMDADALGMTDNRDETLDQAVALGRTGGFTQRRNETRQTRENPVALTVRVTLDEGTVRSLLAAIAAEIDQPAQDATVTFDPSMDEEELMFSVRAERPGRVTDQEGTFSAVTADLAGDWAADTQVIVNDVEAGVTAEYLEGCTQLISYFGTHISKPLDDPRTMNISLALSSFNGLAVNPGETVSFNMMTGERTAAKGYQEAPQIGSDKNLEPALGGGVCQASTTLYNAVLLAGLQIDTRNRHSWPSSYVKEGFDATVNWPDKDFVFTNNTEGVIFIKAGVFKDKEGVNARVWVYGIPLPDGQYYERDWLVVERLDPPESETVPDTNQKYTDYVYYDDEKYVYRESHGSLKIKAYLVLRNRDGAEISRVELYEDYYKPITGLIYTGIVPASRRPPDVNGDGIPDVDSDGDGKVDMLDLDGDRVGDVAYTPPAPEVEAGGGEPGGGDGDGGQTE